MGVPVSAIVGAEDDVALRSQRIHIFFITLGRFVFIGLNKAVIENDHWPAGGGRFARREGEQPENFEPFGKIVNDEAIVVAAGLQSFVNRNLAAGVVLRAHEGNR